MMQARQPRFQHGEHGAGSAIGDDKCTIQRRMIFFGNHVDGWYWQLTEESFEQEVEVFQSVGNWRAAAVADRLVSTTDDVPAQLMSEYQGLWNDVGLIANFDSDFSPLIATYNAMMAEIGQGAFLPADATAFLVEFICRRTGVRAS
jgi:hypothetical protein